MARGVWQMIRMKRRTKMKRTMTIPKFLDVENERIVSKYMVKQDIDDRNHFFPWW
jgi:hypothetical protein